MPSGHAILHATCIANTIGYLDILASLVCLADLAYPTIFKRKWPQPICSILAVLELIFLCLNVGLFVYMSIIACLRVHRKTHMQLGPYDYQAWIIIITIALAMACLCRNDYGNSEYYCTEPPDGSVASLFVDSVLLVTLLVVASCLILIRRKIWKIERNVLRGHAMAKSVHDDRDTAKKVAGYLSVFILKWIFLFVYISASVAQDRKFWKYLILAIGTNFGSIFTAILFTIHEGWTSKVADSSLPNDITCATMSSTSGGVSST
ncbi:5835_t:CDS:2 [Paraglomus occultum]|uniref:5835_t:CDS:1 n=1 Tax=Paraglomus occultum TaxID=144539 RepID=A0A9N9AZK0_9GLOM|nr:5835_t:CDS:2 [Paraglomus occultum]